MRKTTDKVVKIGNNRFRLSDISFYRACSLNSGSQLESVVGGEKINLFYSERSGASTMAAELDKLLEIAEEE